jgi:hypothetical protein
MPTRLRKLYRCDVLPSPMNSGKRHRLSLFFLSHHIRLAATLLDFCAPNNLQ